MDSKEKVIESAKPLSEAPLLTPELLRQMVASSKSMESKAYEK